jgi:hypothetical protein
LVLRNSAASASLNDFAGPYPAGELVLEQYWRWSLL